ncbi:MAG: pentapeptide repeat-containing protein [Cyanobacteria bacterium SID2]|nr:pentapeptide repeat-containing protein [Cyanobacteria bacterium SID2]MBP0006124.1 pentapeptide repeat-containing protein [Cyanobacteria bacterium SBC]
MSKLERTCIEFLVKSPQERLCTLQNLGLARYASFLTQMPLTTANIRCVMGFLGNAQHVKFPKLVDADLGDLVLDGANLIRGDLSGANLRGTRLFEADLLFANLSQADLTHADLRGAALYETLWSKSIVTGCRFGEGLGLTQEQYEQLKCCGGVFDRR